MGGCIQEKGCRLRGGQAIDEADLSNLRDVAGDDYPNMLAELLGLFEKTTPERLAQMKRALEAGDLASASREAHSLKSSSASLGARAVSTICKEIEHEKSAEAMFVQIARIEAEFIAARDALRDVLSRLKLDSVS